MRLALVLVLALAGCRHKETETGDTGTIGTFDTAPVDLDGDGSPADEDCDDGNSAVYPGNSETPYNGLDDDCDESTPDDDLDGDGVGVADACDDEDDEVAPGLVETCDGKDNDCSGEADDAVGDFFYADLDQDGTAEVIVGAMIFGHDGVLEAVWDIAARGRYR